MITWIVSYPRSGNYLTRQILLRCFGLKSLCYSPAAQPIDSIVRQRHAGSHLIKTHCTKTPMASERVIYVVRDGRAAMSSYRRFLNDIGRNDTLEDVVRAVAAWRPNWSDHVGWALDRDPANTLFLRYEELSSNPSDEVLARISEFIGLPVIARSLKPFDWYRTQRPKHCRVGHNGEGIAAVESQCSKLFWKTHGETMQQMGYAPAFSIAAE